ncbi:mariner Mos1 transposase [Trichonephila clavipes]|nr:mariner Mos1 transposase [Trichonephila clavipes]
MVAQRLTQITPPAAAPDQLRQRVEAAWSVVLQEHIQSLFESMPRIVSAAYRMLSNTYGEATISERTYREWFHHFNNGDFDIEDQHGGGREKVFEDAELEALLDQDSCQTQQELAG